MIIKIDGCSVGFDEVVVSEMGYGRKLTSDHEGIRKLEVCIDLQEFIERFRSAYNSFLDEIKEEECKGEEVDPAFLFELNFPSMEKLVSTRSNEFNVLLSEYLYHSFSEIFFGDVVDNPSFKYVINKFQRFSISGKNLRVQGLAFDRRPIAGHATAEN